MLLPILSALLGAVLGFQFDVRILIPAFLLVWIAAFGMSLLTGWSGTHLALQLALVTVVLQLSYLLGTTMRSMMAGQWADRRRERASDGPAAKPVRPAQTN